jgi:two-component system phosphate regulon sensor histidine kinase PhoR
MSDTRHAEIRPGKGGLAALAFAAATAILLLIWRPSGDTGRLLLILAAAAAAVGIVIYVRRMPFVAQPGAARAAAGTETFALPYALIVERAADPMLVVAGGERTDLNARRFLFANAAARELLRIQRPEGPLTTAIRAPEVLAAIDEALFEHVVGHSLYQAGGVQDRVWRVRVEPLEANDSARLALVCLRDETEVRRAERTRADFLANASHELRTPLASLSGFVETLRGHARDDVDARDRFLAIMQVQAERMRRLIDDLLSLSRIELGEHIAPSGRVDLSVAVIDVLDALAPLAEEKDVAFVHVLPAAGEALAVADRDQILQVIQNLAENALKYTPAGGAVTVSLESGLESAACAVGRSEGAIHLSLLTPDHAPDRRYAALRVADQGPGIARANLPRLTERFYRVEGQKSGEHAGTGLGLAIVKHIVNRHRGGLTVESAEGKGAAFTAYFPILRRESQDPA